MRRHLLVAAAATALLVGGCTGGAEESPPPHPGPTTSSAPPSPEPTATPPSLDVPDDARVLVPETADGEDRHLPDFTPDQDVYTIYASCTGTGEVAIADQDDEGSPHPVACDGVRTVGTVHTERTPQRLMVQVSGGAAHWRVAIVSGDQQP
ncbi:hypothetical protein [Streptomyces sp. C10-9-1]|uniref:hypothetical protein n=1 Tax=Streptomyces sp. C10-9-1 TaxID=1859285 RepID=UPI003F4A46F7